MPYHDPFAPDFFLVPHEIDDFEKRIWDLVRSGQIWDQVDSAIWILPHFDMKMPDG